jgi:hypothetical protein
MDVAKMGALLFPTSVALTMEWAAVVVVELQVIRARLQVA